MKVLVTLGLFWMLSFVAFLIMNAAAWVDNVIVCIQHQEWILLLIGTIVPPIGMIHGWGLWLGLFLT